MKSKLLAGLFALLLVGNTAKAAVWLVPLPEIFYALWTAGAIAIHHDMKNDSREALEKAYGVSIHSTMQYKHIISWSSSYFHGDGLYTDTAKAVRIFHENLLDIHGKDAVISDIPWLRRIVAYGPKSMNISLRGFNPKTLNNLTFGQAFGGSPETINLKRMAQLSLALSTFCEFHESECQFK